MRKLGALLLLVLLVSLAAACAGGEPPTATSTPTPAPTSTSTPTPTPTPSPTTPPAAATGTLEVRVTDAPTQNVSKIEVSADKVEVHKAGAGEDSGWSTLVDAPVTFDLIALRGIEEILGSSEVEAGDYTQIRIHVTRVSVVADGESMAASVPSETLKVVRPFTLEEGGTLLLTLDFDADKSVVITGQGKAQFKPVVKLLVRKPGEPLPTPTPTATTLTLTDDLGRTVEIEGVPEKIVSLAPSNTEILFALGLGDRVVGRTDFCDYPEEARQIPSVGSPFPGFNLETIVSLEPDLVLAFGFGQAPPDYVTQLEGLGVKVLVLAPEDLDAVMDNIELVGKATGAAGQAEALAAAMRAGVQEVVAVTGNAPRPRVFWEFDATDPTRPWTAGPGSFNHELIELAGGANVGASGPTSAFQMNTEELLVADPEIILLGDFQFGTKVADVVSRPGWAELTAVKNGAIYPIEDANLTDRPGPRIVEGLKLIASLIHPELFP